MVDRRLDDPRLTRAPDAVELDRFQVNLDNTAACPISGWCAYCGESGDLDVGTTRTPIGLICVTACERCTWNSHQRPPLSLGTVETATRVGEHCQHLGINLATMASQLDRENGS